jgi:hypothetical protein
MIAQMSKIASSPVIASRVLVAARDWLVRDARTIAAVILFLLAAVLLRNGIAGLTK